MTGALHSGFGHSQTNRTVYGKSQKTAQKVLKAVYGKSHKMSLFVLETVNGKPSTETRPLRILIQKTN